MRAKLLARRLHKWLALLVGAQLLVFYMVAVHIDIIHGDMLVRPVEPGLGQHLDGVLPVPAVLDRHPDAGGLTLSMRGDQPIYRLERVTSNEAVGSSPGGQA